MYGIGSKKNINKVALYFIIFIFSILCYLGYLLFIHYFNINKEHDYMIIYLLSWLGILLGLYVLFSWYKLTESIFSLYTIFMLFFFLFNYGQPLMWALGIHQADEIGQSKLYTLGRATTGSIIYTQILTLISIIMFHLGAVFCYKPKKHTEKSENNLSFSIDAQQTSKIIFNICLILSFIVIPITFYNSIDDLIYARNHGYQALYYDENRSSFAMFRLLQYMFFPCLVGLLVGSKYKRNVRYLVYTIFLVYLVINLLAGERGNWVYYLVILIFMSHNFFKRIKWKRAITYTFIGILFLYIIDAIVALRNTGITTENVLKSLSLENSPIISTVFEMGSSMQPSLVLIQYGWDIWPYSNSYINSILGVVSSEIFTILDIPFNTLSSWFSQDYLGISYGAGFSIIAEPLINFGPVISPLFMVVLGYIIASLTFLDKNMGINNYPLRVFFTVTTMSALIEIVRNHSHFTVKSWFFGVLIIYALVLMVRGLLKNQINVQTAKVKKSTIE